jgi:hypothetical protein
MGIASLPSSASKRQCRKSNAATEPPQGRMIDQLEAEQGALRHILRTGDADKCIYLKGKVTAQHFQDPDCRAIAEVLWTQSEATIDDGTPEGKPAPIDLITISTILNLADEKAAHDALNKFMATPERLRLWEDCVYAVEHWKLAVPKLFPVSSLKEIFARPRPDWLVRGLLIEQGYSALTGGYGTFKSFIALDMGLCIATGKAWQGREVKQGAVVYVVAEGNYTTPDRAKAWLIRHQLPIPENFHVLEMPVQIGDPVICARFIEEISELNPLFIVLDTLAKCNVGKDENSSTDMGLFTDGMEKCSRELKAQVMAIHHNNKQGGSRGSNSLPSNVDTHITIKATAGRVATIECEKQKVAPFEAFSLVGRVVDLGEVDEHGDPVTSLIFEPTDKPATASPATITDNERRCLELLPASGATSAQWLILADEKGIGRSTFYYCRDALVLKGRVQKDGEVYSRLIAE